jgi:hypothetical protein
MFSEFLQVRGTPASGKTTLAKLLIQHIHVQEPSVNVIWIPSWKLDEVEGCGGWYLYLKNKKAWVPGEKTVFVFDDAQVTYRDGELWNELFKNIHEHRDRRAIAFASYGSPISSMVIQGTPIVIAPAARVSLYPTNHEDDLPPAGLLYTLAEFNELVSKHYPDSEYHFDRPFLDMVFQITRGHAGAIYSFLKIIGGSDVMYFSC